MRRQNWLAVVVVAGLLVLGGWPLLLAQEKPPKGPETPADEDMEWLEMETGPGPGPSPGPGPGMGPPSALDRPRAEWDRLRKWTLDKIKAEDPVRFERIVKIKELADEYRKTEDSRRQDQIEKELRPLVEQELKIQQEENKKRIERLEQKLAHWKKMLKKREENWEQVVDWTVKDITGQNDYLKTWNGPNRPRK